MARPRRRPAICMLTKCECTFPVYVLRVAAPRVARGPRGFSDVPYWVYSLCIVARVVRFSYIYMCYLRARETLETSRRTRDPGPRTG